MKLSLEAENAVRYQWQYSQDGNTWNNLYSVWEGNRSDTLTVNVTVPRMRFLYRCEVTGKNGKKSISNTARLYSVTEITAQPQNTQTDIGAAACLSLKAKNALSYQWQYSTDGETWHNLYSTWKGNRTDTLSIEVTVPRLKYLYRCVVTGRDGTKLISDSVQLYTVAEIINQPQDTAANIGETVYLSVKAKNASGYQWQYSADGETWRNLYSVWEGNRTDTLSIEVTAPRLKFLYRCVVTGTKGEKVVSGEARLYRQS